MNSESDAVGSSKLLVEPSLAASSKMRPQTKRDQTTNDGIKADDDFSRSQRKWHMSLISPLVSLKSLKLATF